MKAKRIVFAVALFCFICSCVQAQDDMYFTPKKSDKKEIRQEKVTFYNGSSRNVDEYNRRGQFASSYFNLDSDTLYSDVIEFDTDSTLSSIKDSVVESGDFEYSYTPEDDYVYTRQMCRYDDFIGMIRGGMDGMALIGTEVLIGMQDGGMTHGTTRGIMAGTDLGDGITLDIGMVLITGHM